MCTLFRFIIIVIICTKNQKGVYQQDLTFIQDGNKDILENGYINFFKRILVSEIIKEVIFI